MQKTIRLRKGEMMATRKQVAIMFLMIVITVIGFSFVVMLSIASTNQHLAIARVSWQAYCYDVSAYAEADNDYCVEGQLRIENMKAAICHNLGQALGASRRDCLAWKYAATRDSKEISIWLI